MSVETANFVLDDPPYLKLVFNPGKATIALPLLQVFPRIRTGPLHLTHQGKLEVANVTLFGGHDRHKTGSGKSALMYTIHNYTCIPVYTHHFGNVIIQFYHCFVWGILPAFLLTGIL